MNQPVMASAGGFRLTMRTVSVDDTEFAAIVSGVPTGWVVVRVIVSARAAGATVAPSTRAAVHSLWCIRQVLPGVRGRSVMVLPRQVGHGGQPVDPLAAALGAAGQQPPLAGRQVGVHQVVLPPRNVLG